MNKKLSSKSDLIEELFTDEELATGIKIKILKEIKPCLCPACQKIVDQEISEIIFEN